MPPLITTNLWPAQVRAIQGLETSLAEARPRALIQMATGSGKTFTACNFMYRLIQHANAHRILFLVDRNNLGRQTLKAFQAFRTPDDGRIFTELYNVQQMRSNTLDLVSRVTITTIQRRFSMLKGEEIDPALEEGSIFQTGGLPAIPVDLDHNPSLPIETFDFIVTDECHRSIYNLWRQVLEYFDASLIGLTATPSKQTLGFFNQNLVMEYNHDQAVAAGVNVTEHQIRLKEAGLTDNQIKRVVDPMLESFHLQLKEEVESYERLKRGEFDELENFRGFGHQLISLRIAKGISQRELAKRLGVHESQV